MFFLITQLLNPKFLGLGRQTKIIYRTKKDGEIREKEIKSRKYKSK